MRDYTETVRDVRKLVQQERDEDRRQQLLKNVDAMDREFQTMRAEITTLRIQNANVATKEDAKRIAQDELRTLVERVEWNTWLLRGVIVATVLEIIGGITVAFIVHGMGKT